MNYVITLSENQLRELKYVIDSALRACERDPSQMELDFAVSEFSKHQRVNYLMMSPKHVREAIKRGIPMKIKIGPVFNIQREEFCYRVSLAWEDSRGEKWQYDPSYPIQGKTVEEWGKQLFNRLLFYRMNRRLAKSLAAEGVELMIEFRTEQLGSKHKKDLIRWFRNQGEKPEIPPEIVTPIYEENKKDSGFERIEGAVA